MSECVSVRERERMSEREGGREAERESGCTAILACNCMYLMTFSWRVCLQSYKLGPKDDIKAKAKKGKKGKKGGGKKGKVSPSSSVYVQVQKTHIYSITNPKPNLQCTVYM